jgi:tricorn protease
LSTRSKQGKSTQITDGLSDARYPNFDKNGKYLYFTASTNAGPQTAWLDMSSFPYRVTRSVYVVVLKKGEASPLAPESDEEKIAEEKKDEAPKPPAGAAKKEDVKVTIDFAGIGQRILALQIPARNYVGLGVGKANILFIAEAIDNAPGLTIQKYDLEKKKLTKCRKASRLLTSRTMARR